MWSYQEELLWLFMRAGSRFQVISILRIELQRNDPTLPQLWRSWDSHKLVGTSNIQKQISLSITHLVHSQFENHTLMRSKSCNWKLGSWF
jgi:hypothetical protein